MVTTIRLDPDIEQRLSALAKLTGRTKSYYIRTAVEEMLEDMEDVYAAEKLLERPNERWWSLQELMDGKDLEH